MKNNEILLDELGEAGEAFVTLKSDISDDLLASAVEVAGYKVIR